MNEDGEPGQHRRGAVPRPGGGEHQDHRAEAQYLFGEDEEEVVQHQ
jgi:hypothetical protein